MKRPMAMPGARLDRLMMKDFTRRELLALGLTGAAMPAVAATAFAAQAQKAPAAVAAEKDVVFGEA